MMQQYDLLRFNNIFKRIKCYLAIFSGGGKKTNPHLAEPPLNQDSLLQKWLRVLHELMHR